LIGHSNVVYIHLQIQGEVLQMAYMDVPDIEAYDKFIQPLLAFLKK